MVRDIGKVLIALALACGSLSGLALAIEVGESAPDFDLTDMKGVDHSLSTYVGHPTLLVFLSCSDGTSRSVAPLIQSDLLNPYSSRGLKVLGIDCQGSTMEQMTEFWHDTGVDFPLLMDGEGVLDDYGLIVVSLVLVDGGGVVRYISSGQGGQAYDRDSVVSVLEGVLREAASSKVSTWGLIKGLYSD